MQAELLRTLRYLALMATIAICTWAFARHLDTRLRLNAETRTVDSAFRRAAIATATAALSRETLLRCKLAADLTESDLDHCLSQRSRMAAQLRECSR